MFQQSNGNEVSLGVRATARAHTHLYPAGQTCEKPTTEVLSRLHAEHVSVTRRGKTRRAPLRPLLEKMRVNAMRSAPYHELAFVPILIWKEGKRFRYAQSGATAVEYGLFTALVSV